MREVISYIFTFSFLLCPLALGCLLLIKLETSKPKWMIYMVISSVICYFCVIFSVWSIDWHYKYELDKFDLDGDGMFSGKELTPEMDEAMKRLTSDTGRTFAPITGVVISPIYNGFWFIIFALFTFVRHWLTMKREARRIQ